MGTEKAPYRFRICRIRLQALMQLVILEFTLLYLLQPGGIPVADMIVLLDSIG